MKFVTFAVAVLLAVGCQAASLQADAPAAPPSTMDRLNSYASMLLDQVKEAAHNVAERIADEATKNAIITNTDAVHASITDLKEQVLPFADSGVKTIEEATKEMRISIYTDMDNLQKELQPLREDLRATIEKHIEAYKLKLVPLMQDYRQTQEEQMKLLKTKFEPQLTELRTLIDTNVDETKSKLMPIVDTIRKRITERVESVKAIVEPYVQEYREQMKKAVIDAQSADYQEILGKLKPKMEGVKTSFNELLEEVQGLMGQQQ